MSGEALARKRVLLTVTGSIPADLDQAIGAGRRPQADYLAIASSTGADLADVDAARREGGRSARLIERVLGAPGLLAWYCLRNHRRYDVVISDGEQVGLPFAFLAGILRRRHARHVMIVHVLSTRSKLAVFRLGRCDRAIDRYVVYCTAQRELLTQRLGVTEDKVVLMPFMVDTDFFSPRPAPAGRRPVICSAGLERRDYPTLIDALNGLDVDVVIAAASPWSRQRNQLAGVEMPENVDVRQLDHFDLRDLYAESDVFVMPLDDVDFQAGITAILEAMAMGLPVVVTRSSGQTDTIVDEENGLYVPPADSAALREAVVRLLEDRSEASRLGTSGRNWVVRNADVWHYARSLGEVADEALAAAVGAPRSAARQHDGTCSH